MNRLEALLNLYRLALLAPEEDHTELLRTWLAERQRLLDLLGRASPTSRLGKGDSPQGKLPTSIEQALVAVIQHADRVTQARMLERRNALSQHLKALRGRNLFSGMYPAGRSRGFFG